MKPYDPKLNPNKSLEETIENFIAWIRTSNRGTASVLKNINDKLLDISKTEESLKKLETSQIESLNQISSLLASVSDLSSEESTEEQSTDFQTEIQNSLTTITNQLNRLNDSIEKNQEEMQSALTFGMNRLDGDILDIKSDILTVSSQLQIKRKKDDVTIRVDKSIQKELAKIREQIICKTEQDKETILQIIDDLISNLTGVIEISGIELKKQLVIARSQVYEKTEGLAPRFRKMMDNLALAISEDTIYSSASLESVLIEGLRFIREIYSSAPVG